MASVWVKRAALAVFLVACVILVTAAPYEEELMEHAADQQETSVDVVPMLLRIRRGDDHGHHGHGYGYLGPVYTYAKTDHYANFKWGVRHHVGGHGHHG